MKFGAFLTSLATLFACAPDSKYLANVRESLPQKTISDVIAEIKNGKTQTVLVVLRREAVLPLNLVQPPEDESARSLWLTRNAAYLAKPSKIFGTAPAPWVSKRDGSTSFSPLQRSR